MGPKMMGITGLPRYAGQGPLNVPRETLPHFQQGGGLFGTAPAPAMNAQPNFNLNLPSQALSDPRGAYVPVPGQGVFNPNLPGGNYGAGDFLVDPSTMVPTIQARDYENAAFEEGAPVGVGSPDTMYDFSGGAGMGTSGIEYYSPPTRYVDEGTRDFDNAMDTAGMNRDKASAFNSLYGGVTALPGGESTKNAFTESQEGQAYLQAERDALDQSRIDYAAETGTATQYGDKANLIEDYNRMLAGETTGVSGKSLVELGIVNPFEGPALMNAGVQSPVFSNYDPAIAATQDYSPEGIAAILEASSYRGPMGATPNMGIAADSAPLNMDELQKSDPARFNAIMSAMARPTMANPNTIEIPNVAPIDFSGSGNQGGGGAARKANGGGVMSLYPNY